MNPAPAPSDTCKAQPAYGASFATILGEEVAHLRALREKEGLPPGDATGDTAAAQAKSAAWVGLALSGGGIRSATFNLGIIQALAKHDMLRLFDYLSTVSGGGYIGAWLSALLYRQNKQGQRNHDWTRALLVPPPTPGSDVIEAPTLRFLRRYSNYLTPKLGALSGDTLAAIATYLRNLGLNLATLVALGMAVMLLPHLLVHGGAFLLTADPLMLLALAAAFALFAVCFAAIGLASASAADGAALSRTACSTGVAVCIILPAVIAAALLTLAAGHDYTATAANIARWSICAALFYGASWMVGFALIAHATPRDEGVRGLNPGDYLGISILTLLAGAVGGALLHLGLGYVLLPAQDAAAAPLQAAWRALGAGAPMALTCMAATLALHVGLLRRYLSHEAREWWSRVGGLVLGVIVAWVAMFALVSTSPALIRWLHDWVWQTGGAWASLTLVGVWLAKSPFTGGEKSKLWAEVLARIAPWVFLIGIGIALAAGSHALLKNFACDTCADNTLVEHELALFDLERTTLIFLGFLAAFLLLGYRIDINLFSIHHFYRNRLVRAYLGAARFPEREAHPFTGFSREDDLPLAELAGQRPFHILNTAINISGGEELAWQTRRAASFTFTPLYCGYEYRATRTTDLDAVGQPHGPRGGYRPSRCFQSRWGVYLGTAMGISGAAASPLSGYHTKPALGALMTVFNVRLGQWMGNPEHPDAWRRSSPRFGGRCLLRELTGSADTAAKFVYLSDGGHFENLGIYELVRRHSTLIVACDAGCDPNFAFDDLANAIRKCKIDLGVDIDIRIDKLRPKDGFKHTTCHFAAGVISYPDGGEGVLLYIKASLTGEEPPDILNYAANHPQFPHDTTADQFFDEDQFETYRALGYHIGDGLFGALRKEAERDGGMDAAAFFAQVATLATRVGDEPSPLN